MAKTKSTTRKEAKGKKGRLVRPYPQLPLEKALKVATAIKEKNGGNPFEPKQIADSISVSPSSSDLVYLLSASGRFGLTAGSVNSEKIALTDFGKEVVYAGTKELEEELKRKAFLQIDIFRKVIEHYKGSQLPEMKYLGNTLQKEFGLVPELHEEFSLLFRENCDYLGLDAAPIKIGTGGDKEASKVAAPATITLGEPTQKAGGTCFVIMPFSERSGKFSKGFFTEVLNSLIIPAVTQAGFIVKTANRQGTEIIHATIVNEILDAEMTICDLTEHNPNVLFELGIRLANEKPVALIHAEGTERVFDVDNVLRVFPYSANLWRTTLDRDIPALTAHVAATWDGKEKNETYMGVLKKMRHAK